MEVTIIGYGVGNLRNLRCRLERADATVALSDDPSTVADHTAVSCDYGSDFAAIASNDAGNVVGRSSIPKRAATPTFACSPISSATRGGGMTSNSPR